MSGIFGILRKNPSFEPALLQKAASSISGKLAVESTRLRESASVGNWHFGSIGPISAEKQDHFIYNEELSVHCVIEGQVYIDETEKQLIRQQFPGINIKNDPGLLPWLHRIYGDDLVRHITGWFNLFLYDGKNETALLCNDRLGLLPLYYYESDQVLMFASKIECLPASGLMDEIAFDPVTLAEQLLFNYPISHQTFIRKISTLPSATKFRFTNPIERITYWSPAEWISEAPLSMAKSLDLIDEAMAAAIRKPFKQNDQPIAATLTGGFDGRLMLSYLLDQYRDRLRVFSFGAASSPDITIPRNIAQKEGFSYEPVILGQDYMDRSFVDTARKTIELSGGIRSFRRAHYLFAMQHMASHSGLVVSGNFGDEVIKFARILPSEVISSALISFIQSGFSNKQVLLQTAESYLRHGFTGTQGFGNELNTRLESIEKEMAGYASTSQKFHHLKFTRIAPGFFGNELGSYNDYMQSFSPFLDYYFLTAFHKTRFAGIYYPFNGNKLEHKAMASNLYAELIRRNKKSLLHYQTDRGYSIKALTHPLGKIKVMINKYLPKHSTAKDYYFLDQSENLFQSSLNKFISKDGSKYSNSMFIPIDEKMGKSLKDKILSLNYWMAYIEKEYFINKDSR